MRNPSIGKNEKANTFFGGYNSFSLIYENFTTTGVFGIILKEAVMTFVVALILRPI